ncbi:MAG: IS1182 family transposase, partial [Bacilli bacterium]|nr:IS1182 family transposase [Bacilli bacterium]
MLLLKNMFGIKSIRETMRQIEVNVAYRWYLNLNFDQEVPDHSTISKTYARRFADNDIFEKLFIHILSLADSFGYLGNDDIHGDATHIKASANKRKYEEIDVEAIDSIKERLLVDINELREELDQKPIELEKYETKDDDLDNDINNRPGGSHPDKKYYDEDRYITKKSTKKVKVSKVDKDAGYYYRDEKEKGFVYQDHRLVDGLYNFIIATSIEPGNIHDSKAIFKALNKLEEYGFEYKKIALDSGYNNVELMEYLNHINKYAVIAHRRFSKTKDKSYYDIEQDFFVCEMGCIFKKKNVNKSGVIQYYHRENCYECPKKCFSGKTTKFKIFTRHIWAGYRDDNRTRRLSSEGKELYTKRKETVERSFADSKQNHGLRWTLYRGITKNQNYNFLLCAAQNLKKICRLKAIEYAIEQENKENGPTICIF